jgi:hypothetical protein
MPAKVIAQLQSNNRKERTILPTNEQQIAH